MKTPPIILSLFLLSGFATQAQNILRVNNIPAVNAPYNTIAAAIAAAGPNDIILVEGSPFVYDGAGSFTTIAKKVTLVGTGYFIDASVQVNPYTSQLGNITFNPGSDGSIVTGFDMSVYSILIKAPNVTVSNNYCANITFTDVSNVTIKENYITGTILRGFGLSALTLTNILISNNYVDNLINTNGNGPTFSVVSNNIIAKSNTGNCALDNAQVTNNIFLSAFSPTAANPVSSSTNTNFSNNLFVAPSQTSAGITNIFNISAASLFVGLAGNNTDTQWKLKVGSPASGAGASGVDCGMYGAANPYKPYGIRLGQPTLTGFSAPGTVPVNGTLNVKVSAKVN